MTNGHITFQAVVNFVIPAEDAARLLVEQPADRAVLEWLNRNTPNDEFAYSGNTASMKSALGHYLADKRIAECRQLMPGDVGAK